MTKLLASSTVFGVVVYVAMAAVALAALILAVLIVRDWLNDELW